MNRPPTHRPGGAVARTPQMPVCPKCNRSDRVDVEDQSGSSAQWYVCDACGARFMMPPKPKS